MFVVSPSPHLKSIVFTPNLMLEVIISLIPIAILAVLFYGFSALLVMLTAVATCVVAEWFINKYLIKNDELSIKDGSAVITGLLFAFCLPSSVPLWEVILGGVVAIGLAKMPYGGLGKNVFNPALVARVFILVSFPKDMATWPKPKFMNFNLWDGETGATVLSLMKENLKKGVSIPDIIKDLPDYWHLFLTQIGGSLGEVSALLVLICGVYLILRKVISWHIPVAFILTVFIYSYILWIMDPSKYASPILHIFSGGLMLGAFFMATDYVTSPMSHLGKIIFGIGCGIITVVIRNFASLPEGVAFAILFMNILVPVIDKIFKPRVFGK